MARPFVMGRNFIVMDRNFSVFLRESVQCFLLAHCALMLECPSIKGPRWPRPVGSRSRAGGTGRAISPGSTAQPVVTGSTDQAREEPRGWPAEHHPRRASQGALCGPQDFRGTTID